MRTTVTIDADTEHLLREEAKRTGNSLKEVLNTSIRRALLAPRDGLRGPKQSVEPLFTASFPAEWVERNMNQLADALDDEDTLRELAR